MTNRAQIHITPNTITDLTVFVTTGLGGSHKKVLDLADFTNDGTYLTADIGFIDFANGTIYAQGYAPQNIAIDDLETDYYYNLYSMTEYSNINDYKNSKTYYCRDSFIRDYTSSFFEYLENTKADTTLSNVSSIDSNSAVKTALDGKVSKSGDTMTGDLNISKTNPQFHLINTNMELGVTPSENYVSNLRFIDKNETNLGSCYLRQQSSGITDINLNCINPSGGSAATLRVGFNANGDAYSTFPNTYRCDGQWIAESQTICSGRTAETSDKNWTLNLPNDSYDYEVLLVGAVTTGATSGNQARINLQSSIIQSNIVICNAQTRTSSTITTYGACIIPVGSNHTVTVVGWGSNTGAYSLYLRGYRRIGTNE